MTFIRIDNRTSIFIDIIIVLILVFLYVLRLLSKSFLFRYVDFQKSELSGHILLGLHWLAAMVLALVLPDYLGRFDFFKLIFNRRPILNYVFTLFLLLGGLILVSIVLNLIFVKNRSPKNSDE